MSSKLPLKLRKFSELIYLPIFSVLLKGNLLFPINIEPNNKFWSIISSL